MPAEYLTLADIAERVDLTVGALRQLHKRSTMNRERGKPSPRDLPPEDIRLGQTPGWHADTITDWLEERITTPRPN